MIFLHDIWVNWFEGEENGYGVCSFHEWRKTDHVELLDQVPVVKVTSKFFETLENSLMELPKKLMDDIFQQAFIRKNHTRIELEYCAIITDGKTALAIDTIGYNVPIRKSRLIPRQEQQVIDLAEKQIAIVYNIKEDCFKSTFLNMFSPDPITMVGLTRKERQLKQILFIALDQIRSSENISEIRYWFTEWFPDQYQEVVDLTFEDIWRRFYENVQLGWSKQYEALCEKMIKGQPYLEQLWEIEVGERPFSK